MLMTQAATGSFAQSGIATAGYVAGLAVLSPLLGRYIDRRGPRLVLAGSAVIYPCAMLALSAATLSEAPRWMVLLTGLAAGASFPPIPVCMRAIIKRLFTDDERIPTAYSLESVLIELIFIAGPLIVALLVALIAPLAAVVFAAVCSTVGTVLFLRAPALRGWRIEPRAQTSLFGPLATPGFVSLLLVVLCYSSAFGLIEIAVTGFAAARGQPALAGVMLGLMSVGSVTGALATVREPGAAAGAAVHRHATMFGAGALLAFDRLCCSRGAFWQACDIAQSCSRCWWAARAGIPPKPLRSRPACEGQSGNRGRRRMSRVVQRAPSALPPRQDLRPPRSRRSGCASATSASSVGELSRAGALQVPDECDESKRREVDPVLRWPVIG